MVELATRVARFEDSHVTILAPAHMNEYLRRDGSAPVEGRYIPHISKTGIVRSGINEVLTRIWLSLNAPDIVHESYYSPWRAAPRKTKTVVTVYDMIHEKFPQYFLPSNRTAEIKARAVKRAAHVICISETTRTDLLQIIPLDPAKVSVVHLGHALATHAKGPAQPHVSDPYLLFVGKRSGYKNFTSLLTAYAASRAAREGIRLVCFGGGPLVKEELDLLLELRVSDKHVIQIDGEDQVLANLYANALALVCPSVYEGFGMPLLEAMSFSCPVICSNTGSLPEVVGEAAEFFDPDDPSSIAGAVDRIVFSPERLTMLRALGSARASEFSWERCAAETYSIYTRLVS